MHVAASGGPPVTPLLQAAVLGSAGLAASFAAVALAPVAALAHEEASPAPAAELLQQRSLVLLSAIGHAHSADSREVDDHARTWQKSG